MKNIVWIFLFCCLPVLSAYAGKSTHISAEIQGFNGKMVYFDFIEKEGIDQEFPYSENRVLEVEVELEDITMLKINSWIRVCLQPGDSIHARITYSGDRYETVEYTGTPAAVTVNTFLHRVRSLRAKNKLKTNIPALLVTLVQARDYHVLAVKEWKDEIRMLDEIKGQITVPMYNYLRSDLEGTWLSNIILYPYASSSFHKKELKDCFGEDYWTILEDFTLRADDASLRNRTYMSFLIPYKTYMLRKQNPQQRYEDKVNDVEKEYRELADFYEGPVRDAALFVHLYNAVAQNKDFNLVEKLKKDYQKKYNKNKNYRKILDNVMK